jgi:hypothetical protein
VTVYTASDLTQVGGWIPSTRIWTAGVGVPITLLRWGVVRFTGLPLVDSHLTSATLAFDFSAVTLGGTLSIDVVTNDTADLPSATTIPNWRYARVGTVVPAATLVASTATVSTLAPHWQNWSPRSGVHNLTFVLKSSALINVDMDSIPGTLTVETTAIEPIWYRCGRCGTPVDTDTLVKDGYNRTEVCPQCFDPSQPAPNWRWPFRS